jgi:hypothetical protein
MQGSNWARGIKTLKEALDGDKEKGCQEKEKEVTGSGAKSPHHQGKIVVTGVRHEHPFLFAAAGALTHDSAGLFPKNGFPQRRFRVQDNFPVPRGV